MKASNSLLLAFTVSLLFLTGILSDYEIILEHFETLLGDDDQMFENINVRIKKFNRSSYVADGVLRMKRPLDNSLQIGFRAYNQAGGQYKMIAERFLGPVCKMLYEDHMRPCIEEFFGATNVTHWYWGECPIVEGLAAIKNYAPTTVGDYIPPYLPGGEKWKVSFYFVDSESVTIGGASVYAKLRSNYSLLRYGG